MADTGVAVAMEVAAVAAITTAGMVMEAVDGRISLLGGRTEEVVAAVEAGKIVGDLEVAGRIADKALVEVAGKTEVETAEDGRIETVEVVVDGKIETAEVETAMDLMMVEEVGTRIETKATAKVITLQNPNILVAKTILDRTQQQTENLKDMFLTTSTSQWANLKLNRCMMDIRILKIKMPIMICQIQEEIIPIK